MVCLLAKLSEKLSSECQQAATTTTTTSKLIDDW